MKNTITLQAFTGSDLQPYITELARLRIEVFREFPYLYDGDMDYEKRYLRTYLNSPDSVIVIAFDSDGVVGASTAIPLKHETDEIKRPFINNDINPDSVFYLGESVLGKAYRGQGIGVKFFQAREAHARRAGFFEYYAFCAVNRPANHPRRPQNYAPLDQFWNNRGYFKHPELSTTMTWKELDESVESPKPMTFWLKTV